MSILGNSELNKIVNDLGIIETNEILTFLHRMMIATLDHQESTTLVSNVLVLDGMDIALCRFDKKKPQMQFSSANRPLLHIKGDQIQEYQTDKASIGPAYRYYELFHAMELDLTTDDTFFLFSDGIVDQFGGPKDKKLTKKRLIEFLITMQSLPFAEQGLLLEQFMDNWMSHTRQTDDMTLIGIRCPCKG
jgi:serine phosphatase RsbU (regulator of sigma subunit)